MKKHILIAVHSGLALQSAKAILKMNDEVEIVGNPAFENPVRFEVKALPKLDIPTFITTEPPISKFIDKPRHNYKKR